MAKRGYVSLVGGVDLGTFNIISECRGAMTLLYQMMQHRSVDVYRTCLYSEKLEQEFMEETGYQKASLTRAIRHLRRNNIIKAIREVNGYVYYTLNPTYVSSVTSDPELAQGLYDTWVDGDFRGNYKIWQELKSKGKKKDDDNGDKLGNTGGDQSNPDKNKTNNGGEEPKGDSKKTDPKESTLENLKSLSYDTDHKNNPNMPLIRKAKGEFYSRTKKDLGSFVNMEYAVIRGKVVGRCNGQVEGSLYDEKENKSYIRISE